MKKLDMAHTVLRASSVSRRTTTIFASASEVDHDVVTVGDGLGS
jgi:hypothetical protein